MSASPLDHAQVGLDLGLGSANPEGLFDWWAGAAPVGRFDELRHRPSSPTTRSGPGVSPLWRSFLDAEVPTRGPEGELDFGSADALAAKLNHVDAATQRQVHANGITYNVYSGDSGQQRPWSLDGLPWIIDAADWAHIERGVEQRAQLLNRLMEDVYGEQRALREGLLPSALVHGHPGYLRPLCGWKPREGSWLQLVAFDLTRQPDGRWAVVSQRAQAPSGLGYLLENRVIISRQFPAAFASLRVQRMAGAYRAWMDNLYRLSPDGDRSRIVLLTPGPYNETYFEHAYLARYLGVPLVEGGDLMVRDERLYLKALHGLERVHGVLRRLDDDFCDPLELRADSSLGVPGLLQAVRAGNVVVFNSLGAGFLESPAIHGFLPGLCERWLGHPMALPSLDSWWCGEAASRELVMPMLRDCVIKPTGPQVDVDPAPLHQARDEEISALSARIEARPQDFTAQRYSRLSAVPVWAGGHGVPGQRPRIELRPAMLRVYAMADGARSWRVLPGGLGRTAASGRELVSMQRGGSSVDVWVIAESEVDASTLLPSALGTQDLKERHRATTSRAAENLFWLGRYTERAENVTRLAREVLEWLAARSHRAASGVGVSGAVLPARLAGFVADLSSSFGLVNASVPGPAQSQRLFERALVADLTDPSAYSLAFNLQSLQACAQQVRDRLSREHWHMVDDAVHHCRLDTNRHAQRAGTGVADAIGLLEDTASRLAAITGAQVDRMTRDAGWRMLSTGRQIERVVFVSNVLRLALAWGTVPHQPHESPSTALRVADEEVDAMFDLLLGLCDSRITYRSLFQRRVELLPMLDLLVMDSENPRSLAWVLRTLRRRVLRLPARTTVALGDHAADLPLPFDLSTLSIEDLAALWQRRGVDGVSELEQWLSGLGESAAALSDAIGQRYFSHAMGHALDEVDDTSTSMPQPASSESVA
jgi:uncharacterized circularly permuted ATP-grasp superfamily protein/uncharacterized alpha-E superfamily protein